VGRSFSYHAQSLALYENVNRPAGQHDRLQVYEAAIRPASGDLDRMILVNRHARPALWLP